MALDRGAHLDHRDTNAYDLTALDWAARNGHEDVVKLLLDRGAEVNAKDANGWTALHLATRQGHKGVVLLLLGRGSDVGAKTSRGSTPLDLATTIGYMSIVDVLLEVNTQEHFKRCFAAEVSLISVVHGGGCCCICLSIFPRVLTLCTADSTCHTAQKACVYLGRLV